MAKQSQKTPTVDISDLQVSCGTGEHAHSARSTPTIDENAVERASRIYRALGDTSRFRLAIRLAAGPACVSELAGLEQESITTISQRLRVLRSDNIIRRRRDGKHMLYFLSDTHMLNLVLNGLAHVSEPHHSSAETNLTHTPERLFSMAIDHAIHEDHSHIHEANCGHTAIQHDDHVDYLHDGHLHHPHEGHVDEHALKVDKTNPDTCTDGHDCGGHDADHRHGVDCGHEAVPHGDHMDYLVDGHLHYLDGDHCDNHGSISVVQQS